MAAPGERDRAAPKDADKRPLTVLDRLRIGALDLIARGPGAVARLTYVNALLVCLTALAILVLVRPEGALPRTHLILGYGFAGVLCLLAVGGIVWMRLGSRSRPTPPCIRPRGDTLSALLLALATWLPLALVPVYLLARATQPPSETWLAFGYLDKRWVIATYMLGTVVAIVLLPLAARIVSTARTRPSSWRDWAAKLVAGAADEGAVEARRQNVLGGRPAAALKVVAAVVIAAYFFGPPWYVNQYLGAIDYHEHVHLGGLQAISRGAIPYVDEASVQYGPGTQLAMYAYMRYVDGFTIVGFRESFAVFHWIGATLFFGTIFLRLRLVHAVASVLVAALAFPTLQLFGFAPGGPYVGFWGWGNILRYVGVFLVAMWLPAVVLRQTTRAAFAAGIALGMVWGALCYASQENLAGGVLASGTIATLLVVTASANTRRVLWGLAGVAAGALITWLPILGYYAAHGSLGRFATLYFSVPSAVARGYSNTPYLEGFHSAWGPMYYFLPFVLACLGLACLLRIRPFSLATRWTPERTVLVSAAIAAIVTEQGALLRADSSHLFNSMLALPIFIVLAIALLPRVLGLRLVAAVAVSGMIVGTMLLLIPREQYRLSVLQARLEAPARGRVQLARAADAPDPPSGAAERVGPGLYRAPVCCTASDVSMPKLTAFMDKIQRLVGDRPVYVASFKDGYPGFVYFLADLNPAPIYLEPFTLVTTAREQAKFLEFFTQHLGDVRAVISLYKQDAAVTIFADAFSRHRTTTLMYRGEPLYVLTRQLEVTPN